MANPVGRPKSDVETKVVAVRISTTLWERLDRYVDLATHRGEGAKASINSVVSYAIQFFLDAKESEKNNTRREREDLSMPTVQRREPQQPLTPARESLEQLRKMLPASGSIRRKIIELLAQQHPQTLSPAETKNLLGVDKDLSNTMKAMKRDHLLSRSDRGQYTVHADVLKQLEARRG